jgi:hypothetical protein
MNLTVPSFLYAGFCFDSFRKLAIYTTPTLCITVMSTASLTGDAQPVNTSNNLNRSRHAHLVFPAYLPEPNFVYQYNYVNRFNLVAEEVD